MRVTMDYKTANELLNATVNLNREIDIIISVTKNINDPMIKGKLQKIIGEIAGLSTDIIFEIEKFFPELNPDRETE